MDYSIIPTSIQSNQEMNVVDKVGSNDDHNLI
jgi:hypothetical protein